MQKETNKEVGYLLRYNKETREYFADFFWGVSDSKWLDLSKNPYYKPLDKDEIIIGFVHTHPGWNSSTFGPDDIVAISKLS